MPPDLLNQAKGYCDLQLYDEALQTLDKFELTDRESKPAYALRLMILVSAKRWKPCLEFAERIADAMPDWSLPRLLGAEALDQQGKTQAALTFLTDSGQRVSDAPGYWYQLASYKSRLGDLKGAKEAVSKVAKMSPELRHKMTTDPSLKTFWEAL
ncbi:hypothetical protein N9260_01715 [bacterium]|nr:hypothetical protein [bacterium]